MDSSSSQFAPCPHCGHVVALGIRCPYCGREPALAGPATGSPRQQQASETDLPARRFALRQEIPPNGEPLACYRRRGRLASYGVGLAAYVAGIVAGVVLGWPSLWAVLGFPLSLVLVSLGGFRPLMRARVCVYPDRLTAIGYWDRYDVPWDQVADISVGRNPSWHGRVVCVHTSDGREIRLVALDAGRGEGPGYPALNHYVDELLRWRAQLSTLPADSAADPDAIPCPHCGEVNSAGLPACPQCGTRRAYCHRCEARVDPAVDRCPRCGAQQNPQRPRLIPTE